MKCSGEGVSMHADTRTLIKENCALVVQQGLRTTRGDWGFLQEHPEPKLLSSSDLSEYEFLLQWDQWDRVIVF